MSRNKDLYKACDNIKRTTPDNIIDEQLKIDIAQQYRTLPTFEKTVFEHKHIKHYSLERNELLKCRWKEYRDHLSDLVIAPFQFPDVRDLHFYNGAIRFIPALSIFRFPEYRMKLKPGPGVDFIGQMPIPFELFMKRGVVQKEDKEKKVKSNKNTKADNKKVYSKKGANSNTKKDSGVKKVGVHKEDGDTKKEKK